MSTLRKIKNWFIGDREIRKIFDNIYMASSLNMKIIKDIKKYSFMTDKITVKLMHDDAEFLKIEWLDYGPATHPNSILTIYVNDNTNNFRNTYGNRKAIRKITNYVRLVIPDAVVQVHDGKKYLKKENNVYYLK